MQVRVLFFGILRDLAGQATAIVALGCLAGSIIEGGALGWTNPYVATGMVVFLIAAASFVNAAGLTLYIGMMLPSSGLTTWTSA